VRPRDKLRGAAIPFAIDAALAMHPRTWRWANKGKRKALEIPVWRRVARAIVGGLLLGAVAIYFESERQRLKVDQPELFD
jgi:hypothetical protein